MAAGLIVLFYAQASLAFITDPELEPNPVEAGQAVNVLLTTGVCDGVLGGENNPEITVDGQSIDVLIHGIREFNPIWCFFPVVDRIFPIDGLLPGDYTVTVRFQYDPFGLPVETETLGELPLTVVQGLAVQSVPMIGPRGVLITIFIVFFMGVLAWTKRFS